MPATVAAFPRSPPAENPDVGRPERIDAADVSLRTSHPSSASGLAEDLRPSLTASEAVVEASRCLECGGRPVDDGFCAGSTVPIPPSRSRGERFTGLDIDACKGFQICAEMCPVDAIDMVAEAEDKERGGWSVMGETLASPRTSGAPPAHARPLTEPAPWPRRCATSAGGPGFSNVGDA